MTPSVPASPDVLHRVDLEVAAHDSRLHDLELTVFQLTQQVEILTAQANTKPRSTALEDARRAMKVIALTEAALQWPTYDEVDTLRPSDWERLCGIVQRRYPEFWPNDPPNVPSPKSKAMIASALERLTGF